MKQWLIGILLALFLTLPSRVLAQGQVLGVHILNVNEISEASDLLSTDKNQDRWKYVTVPLTLDDLNKPDEWQKNFELAEDKKIIPIVRLTTRYENGSWKVPTKKDITSYFAFLNNLSFPNEERYVIVFNEVNHAPEWGGKINPQEYADVLEFTSNWAKSEGHNYRVLPAAMDLAAPNSVTTMEAFNYLGQMTAHNPDIWHKIDYWNSHSYPNPGFSSSPLRVGKNSLRGYTNELSFIKEKSGRDMEVFITETGWESRFVPNYLLNQYYQVAYDQIWQDSRIKAITFFILKGDPGPFSGFTFLDKNNQPTAHYLSLRNLLSQIN